MSICDIKINNITVSDITNVNIHILVILKVQSRIIIFITFTFIFTILHFCPSLLVNFPFSQCLFALSQSYHSALLRGSTYVQLKQRHGQDW